MKSSSDVGRRLVFGVSLDALVNLDRDVHQAEAGGNQLLVVLGGLWIVRDYRDDGTVDIRTNRPKVKIGDSVAVVLDALLDSCLDVFGTLSIK